jgi:hypothetical protein
MIAPAAPPEEDSEDLTDEEIGQAIHTRSAGEVATKLKVELLPGSSISQHELRRRKPHLYWRIRLRLASGEEKMIVYLADWLQGVSNADPTRVSPASDNKM